MHLIKYIQKQLLNSYMFRHQGAIISELLLCSEYARYK
jgi:hypothetical protein